MIKKNCDSVKWESENQKRGNMKLFAYEVRGDEEESFRSLEKEHGIVVARTNEVAMLQTVQLAAGCEGVSTLGHSKMDAALLDAFYAQGVRYITTRTVGYDHIDLAHAAKLGIRVANSNYAPNGVADYTVMLLLMCLRKYKQALWRGQVNDYSLEGLQGREVKDLTIGIMGTGRIGSTVIKNLSGFGCKILAYDLYENESIKDFATYVDLETLYQECDVISLHMFASPQTHHIINKEALQKMKTGVVILNCARGELMDANALIWGIEQEKIGALGLDCFENEEGIYHYDRRSDIFSNRTMAYLRQFHNVVLTQHIAFYTDAAVGSMVRCGVEGLLQMKAGEACSTELVVK